MTKRREPGTLPDAIDRAFEEVGGTERAASFLKIGRSNAYALKDPDPTAYAPMTLEQAEQLGLRGATAIAQHLAVTCGGVFLPPLNDCDGELAVQAGMFGRKSGELMAELFQALADKTVTPDEAREALPEARQAMDAIARVYATLQRLASGNEGES